MLPVYLREKYQAALDRAWRAGLHITATWLSDGGAKEHFRVANAENGHQNIVTRTFGQRVLTCTCEGASHGHFCFHRAYVRHELLMMREEMLAQQAEIEAERQNEMALDGLDRFSFEDYEDDARERWLESLEERYAG